MKKARPRSVSPAGSPDPKQASGTRAVGSPDARQRAGKETIVITGSSGFLGGALISRFAERYDIVGLDFALPPNPPPLFEAVRVDLTSDASVKAALDRVRAGALS